jgi:hypothetical protein
MFRALRGTLAAVWFFSATAISPSHVLAAAADYRFELVGQPVKAGERATVTVRLMNVRTNQPVANAVIFQQRLEMAMQGMAPMTAIVAPALPDGQGNYRFSVQTSMEGDWTLTFAARVQGESEVVRATLRVRATP